MTHIIGNQCLSKQARLPNACSTRRSRSLCCPALHRNRAPLPFNHLHQVPPMLWEVSVNQRNTQTTSGRVLAVEVRGSHHKTAAWLQHFMQSITREQLHQRSFPEQRLQVRFVEGAAEAHPKCTPELRAERHGRSPTGPVSWELKKTYAPAANDIFRIAWIRHTHPIFPTHHDRRTVATTMTLFSHTHTSAQEFANEAEKGDSGSGAHLTSVSARLQVNCTRPEELLSVHLLCSHFRPAPLHRQGISDGGDNSPNQVTTQCSFG